MVVVRRGGFVMCDPSVRRLRVRLQGGRSPLPTGSDLFATIRLFGGLFLTKPPLSDGGYHRIYINAVVVAKPVDAAEEVAIFLIPTRRGCRVYGEGDVLQLPRFAGMGVVIECD